MIDPLQEAYGAILFERWRPKPCAGMAHRAFKSGSPHRRKGHSKGRVRLAHRYAYCRALGHGLWEVRSNLSGGRIARVIFTIVGGEMVLLHGFEKKSQKTPAGDLELARRRKREIDR